jgi:hypothetical protein
LLSPCKRHKLIYGQEKINGQSKKSYKTSKEAVPSFAF